MKYWRSIEHNYLYRSEGDYATECFLRVSRPRWTRLGPTINSHEWMILREIENDAQSRIDKGEWEEITEEEAMFVAFEGRK